MYINPSGENYLETIFNIEQKSVLLFVLWTSLQN